jgi:regulatory protein
MESQGATLVDAHRSALGFLARREYSACELGRRLGRKYPNLSQATVSAVVAQLTEDGLQSDRRFSESRIRSRLGKGYGPVYIRQDLVARGIDPASAAQMLNEIVADEDIDWLAHARQLVERRHPHAADDRHSWQRAARYLQNRGFPSDIIARALGR